MNRFNNIFTGICITCIAGGFLLVASVVSAQETTNARVVGQIKHVTLYRDRALVIREVAIPAGEASRTITVSDLPALLDSDSVYAEAESPTVIRAVRVSAVASRVQSNERLQELLGQMKPLLKRQRGLQSELDVVTENEQLLAEMVSFGKAAGKSDLERGVLNAGSLTELTLFSMDQRRTLAKRKLELQTLLAENKNEIDQNSWQQQQISKANGSDAHEAQIFVDLPKDTAATVRLCYQVHGCGWTPQYTVRGKTGDDSIKLQYAAVVKQMTGESWNNVKLLLSTATPTADASRPILTPLRISSIVDEYTSNDIDDDVDDPFANSTRADQEKLTQLTNILKDNRRAAETRNNSQNESRQRDIQLNALAGQLQQIELQASSRSLRTLAIDANDDLANQTYQIEQLVSLNSRREQQLIQILAADVDGEMYHVATPLLSSFGYRQARVTNNQAVGLLTGPASVYLDDRFVGQMEVPSTASGQKLTIGFGVDPQIRTRRELVAKTDNVKGGNRQISFEYKLVISNFKNQPVTVRLLDRMPVTTEAEELSVTLGSMPQALSEDGLYLRTMRPLGMLRWDMSVPEKRIGADAMDVLYSYTLEFDRNRMPSTQHSLNDILADYDESVGRGGGGFGGGGGGGIF